MGLIIVIVVLGVSMCSTAVYCVKRKRNNKEVETVVVTPCTHHEPPTPGVHKGSCGDLNAPDRTVEGERIGGAFVLYLPDTIEGKANVADNKALLTQQPTAGLENGDV